ncbi:MAG: hypothetical protein C0481_15460 [Phenylobacterium sp.]|uniref:T4SS efffector SepA family protein n=1 Tax=Phenylobacterium sp. TaxID=1871053 RepID=UPI0025F8BF91|nr:hypothetical protein [Phenylobacterium sp.]MBA4013262.1 hypothetical protein [Phenylobacterium sp.]
MPHDVTLSDNLFARLQAHAVPLVDSIETVIARAVDALEQGNHPPAAASSSSRNFNPAAPPNLHHTTPKLIKLNGKTFPKNETYWNYLMYACAREAAKQGLTADQVLALMVVPAVAGKKDDNGYKFLPEVGVSIQGQDANGAWKQAHKFAEALDFKLEVEFTWQNVEKAAMPNVTGSFALA